MYLIAMHQMRTTPDFIEGFHKKYKCITLWPIKYDLTISDEPFFTYTSDTRIDKYSTPFNQGITYEAPEHL